MQTFAPYADVHRSAAVLDQRRLQKQLVETQQLVYWWYGAGIWVPDDFPIAVPRLIHPDKFTHPAMRLWLGAERKLAGEYSDAFAEEYARRSLRAAGVPAAEVDAIAVAWAKNPALDLRDLGGVGGHTSPGRARFISDLVPVDLATDVWPSWWGEEDPLEIHMRHRSNLVFKHFDHYAPLFPADVPTTVGLTDMPITDPAQYGDYDNYFAYRWPGDPAEFKRRKRINFAVARDVLGSYGEALRGAQEEHGWDADHPAVQRFLAEHDAILRLEEEHGAWASDPQQNPGAAWAVLAEGALPLPRDLLLRGEGAAGTVRSAVAHLIPVPLDPERYIGTAEDPL